MTRQLPRKTTPARARRRKPGAAERKKATTPSPTLLETAGQYHLKGRIAEAMKLYRAVLRAEKGRSQEALVGMGLCHELRGETRKAVDFFRRARRLGALPVEDFLCIARHHSEHCDFATAVKWLKDALYHHPRTEDIHDALRDTLERQALFGQRFDQLRQQIRISRRDLKFAAFVAAFGDAQAYLDRNPDVANAGLGGYFHWLTYGLSEGRVLPGLDIGKPKGPLDTSRPWRHFTFRGKAVLARAGHASERAAYEVIVKSWAYQKRRQSAAMQDFQRNLVKPPLISIVVPVYNTDPALLSAMIESVRAQIYMRWELCLADDRSPSPEVTRVLRQYAAKDKRIRTIFRTHNGGISAATNSAIGLARGQYIAFLDHDDLLDDCALLCIAKALDENPDAKILYTDEDKISADGVRYDPHFKPDWNREFFYAQNYISHLTVIKASVVSHAGKLKPDYDGSQDYDLLLRCLELVKDSDIIHIPKVLYSWRAVAGSAALSADSKMYAWESGSRALADHLRRTQDPYSIVERGPFPFTYKPDWFSSRPHLVSIIIPSRDMLNLLKVAVESILTVTTDCRFEILIVDNGSVKPETVAWMKKISQLDSRVRVLGYDVPFNYSKINNHAVSRSAGDILVFMNNDVEVLHADWLKEMASLAARPDVGCVGAKLLFPDKSLQHGGVIIGSNGVASHACLGAPDGAAGYFGRLQLRQEYSAVTAACMAIRRSVFEEVGGFNELDLPVAFNDIDLCLKVSKLGYRNLWTPYATLIHHESASRGREDTPAKRSRFMREVKYMQRTWKTKSYLDPAYNINLSLHSADFSLGVPVWHF